MTHEQQLRALRTQREKIDLKIAEVEAKINAKTPPKRPGAFLPPQRGPR